MRTWTTSICWTRDCVITGATTPSAFRTEIALPGQRSSRRVSRHGQGHAQAGAGSDSGRGLQPHRRRQRTGADTVVQGHRQRQLLPSGRRQALLHQRHRHRKYAQSEQFTGDTVRQRFAALLGRRNARGWLPFRPGHDSWPRAKRFRSTWRLPGCLQSGPAAVGGQADCRAVGLWPGRLSGGSFPAGLVGGTTNFATTHANSGKAKTANWRSLRPALPVRPTYSIDAAVARGRR